MKQAILASLLLLLLAPGLSAFDIRFSGEFRGALSIRGLLNMYDSDGNPTGGIQGDDGLFDQPWLSSFFAPYATRIRFRADVNNATNAFGGFFRVTLHPQFWMNATNLQYFENNEPPIGNVWWQPNPMFRLTFGYFAAPRGNMIGRIYLGDEVILPVAYFGRYHPDRFNSAWTNRLVHAWGWEEEAVGLTVELSPTSDLYIIATLPMLQHYRMFGLGETRKDGIFDLPSDPDFDERGGRTGTATAWDIIAQTGVRIAYNIRGFGQVVASWDGGTGTFSRFSPGSQTRNFYGFDGQFINAHLNLTAVRNLQASFGVEIPLPITRYRRGVGPGLLGANFTPEELEAHFGPFRRQFPYGIDIRATYTAPSGNWAIGSGIAVYIGGYLEAPMADGSRWAHVAAEGGRIEDPFEIGVSLNPEWRGFSRVNLGLVAEFRFVEYKNSNILAHPFTITGFHGDRGAWMAFNVIPYISTGITAGGSAWAGFQIRGQPYYGFPDDNGTRWRHVFMWSVPIGIAFTF